MQQLVEAWENYLAAKANVVSYQTQVKSNEVSLEGTRQEMLVGSKILLDVLNAQRDLVNSQLRLVQAEQNYYVNAYNVLAIMGRLNALDMNLKVKRYDPKIHYHDVRNSW
jgi:outer membrane protein TolC